MTFFDREKVFLEFHNRNIEKLSNTGLRNINPKRSKGIISLCESNRSYERRDNIRNGRRFKAVKTPTVFIFVDINLLKAVENENHKVRRIAVN